MILTGAGPPGGQPAEVSGNGGSPPGSPAPAGISGPRRSGSSQPAPPVASIRLPPVRGRRPLAAGNFCDEMAIRTLARPHVPRPGISPVHNRLVRFTPPSGNGATALRSPRIAAVTGCQGGQIRSAPKISFREILNRFRMLQGGLTALARGGGSRHSHRAAAHGTRTGRRAAVAGGTAGIAGSRLARWGMGRHRPAGNDRGRTCLSRPASHPQRGCHGRH
jgi:hypothetical protein